MATRLKTTWARLTTFGGTFWGILRRSSLQGLGGGVLLGGLYGLAMGALAVVIALIAPVALVLLGGAVGWLLATCLTRRSDWTRTIPIRFSVGIGALVGLAVAIALAFPATRAAVGLVGPGWLIDSLSGRAVPQAFLLGFFISFYGLLFGGWWGAQVGSIVGIVNGLATGLLGAATSGRPPARRPWLTLLLIVALDLAVGVAILPYVISLTFTAFTGAAFTRPADPGDLIGSALFIWLPALIIGAFFWWNNRYLLAWADEQHPARRGQQQPLDATLTVASPIRTDHEWWTNWLR
jgi:hypothetical protein